jgi:nicotinic acid phosphoribosyltransferase
MGQIVSRKYDLKPPLTWREDRSHDVTSSALVTDFYRLTIVQPHDDEVDAFERFAHAQPDNVVLVLGTYDTEMADLAHKA